MPGCRASLTAQLLLAGGCAAAAVAALHFAVVAHDAAAPAPAPVAEPAATPAEQLRLPRVGGTIHLARNPSSVASGWAPVVQILPGGDVTLRRAGPPGGVGRPHAAIVLPGAPFAGLDPGARAAFAEIVGRLVGERPVRAGRFRAVDFDLPAGVP